MHTPVILRVLACKVSSILVFRWTIAESIIAILVKERVKLLDPPDNGQKKTKEQKKQIAERNRQRAENKVYCKLCTILPPRRTWVKPSKKERSHLKNDRTNQLKNAATALKMTIARDRSGECKRKEYNKDISRPDYIPSLNEFVADILCTIKQGDVTLAKPNTTGIIW